MTTSMIERVARAIMEARGGCHVTDWCEAEWNPSVAQALTEARAAIEAMKTTTFEMVEAPAGLEIDPGTADDVWQS